MGRVQNAVAQAFPNADARVTLQNFHAIGIRVRDLGQRATTDDEIREARAVARAAALAASEDLPLDSIWVEYTRGGLGPVKDALRHRYSFAVTDLRADSLGH